MNWIESNRCGKMEVEREISDSMQSKSKVLLVYSTSIASMYLFHPHQLAYTMKREGRGREGDKHLSTSLQQGDKTIMTLLKHTNSIR